MNTTHQISSNLFLSKCMFLGWLFQDLEGNKRYLIDVPTNDLIQIMDDCPVVSKEAFREAIVETEKKRTTKHYDALREQAETSIRVKELNIENLKKEIERRKAEIFEVKWKKAVTDLLHTKAFGEAVVPPEDFYFINDIDIVFCEGRLAYVIEGGPMRLDSVYADLEDYVEKIFKIYC